MRHVVLFMKLSNFIRGDLQIYYKQGCDIVVDIFILIFNFLNKKLYTISVPKW
jgi:hypothetical protein